MLHNQGLSRQIDIYARPEFQKPIESDCPIIAVTTDWKTKNQGFGAVRHKDSHKAVFATETKKDFPKTMTKD